MPALVFNGLTQYKIVVDGSCLNDLPISLPHIYTELTYRRPGGVLLCAIEGLGGVTVRYRGPGGVTVSYRGPGGCYCAL